MCVLPAPCASLALGSSGHACSVLSAVSVRTGIGVSWPPAPADIWRANCTQQIQHKGTQNVT
jgi:hypothetical protein